MIGSNLIDVAITMRALGHAGVEPEQCMRDAARAHSDPRFHELLARRLHLLGKLHPLLAAQRARAAGIAPSTTASLEELRAVLARVEITRELEAEVTVDFIDRHDRTPERRERMMSRREYLAQLSDEALRGRARRQGIELRQRPYLVEVLARHETAQELQVEMLEVCS